MKKKTVLVVAKKPVGGIKTYFKYIYSSPTFDSYRFIIITPSYELKDYFSEVFYRKEYEYIETDDTNSAMVMATRKVLSRIECDLLHTHGFTTGLILSVLAYWSRVPHIMTAHDVILDWQMPGVLGWIKSRAIGIGFSLIDVVMAVGKDAGDNLVRRYPKLRVKGKLAVVRNGIDVEQFSKDGARNLRSELNLDSSTLIFGFFGRFMPQKGFGYLIDAVDLLRVRNPDLKFLIVGFGQGGYIREEQQILRERGLEKWFHFMPHTNEMPSAIRGVDAVVMPSLWEACPLLPMEAMVAGVPVLGSDCIGLKEVIENTPALMFKNANAESLASTMVQFANDRQRYKKLAQEFINTAAEKFNSKQSAAGLQDLYQKVLSGNRVFQLS